MTFLPLIPQRTPPAWGDPQPYGCQRVCVHGDVKTGQCLHPNARMPVDRARAYAGPCGPEAHLITFKQ